MGFWDRFRKPKAEPLAPARPSPHPAPPEAPDDVARLLAVGLTSGPTVDEALYTFARLRQSADEARAVQELVRTAQIRSLPDEILLALGNALVDRGEMETAARVLTPSTTSAALVLLADLAERRGELPNALALVERVLLRDLDYPGARERHRRWRGVLGYEVTEKAVAPGATVVAREPDAPFDLLREVGRGGAAAVYEAVDRELGRHVALKVYHQPERDRTQLAHEAKVAVALEGPGIVRVFDVDSEHGWIALEWAQAGTLREQIRARAQERLLPLARWAIPLADALARVHASGWIHHDVKPANVLLSRTNAAILTDFGTARRIGEPSPPGSLGYISPERMRGRAGDPRDDVYGFGRVLEDVLEIVKDERLAGRARAIALACTGPDDARPVDARAIATRLRVELE